MVIIRRAVIVLHLVAFTAMIVGCCCCIPPPTTPGVPGDPPKAIPAEETPRLELSAFVHPNKTKGPKGISRKDLIGKRIITVVNAAITHDLPFPKDNRDHLKVICMTYDDVDEWLLMVEFADTQKAQVKTFKGRDAIVVSGIVGQHGDIPVLENAELIKVHPFK